MTRTRFLFGGIVLAAMIVAVAFLRLPHEGRVVTIDGKRVNVSVVDTDASREKGLGGRSGLAADEGMLFVFDHDERYPFWMKDMKFSIDIVWITSDHKIAYIMPSLSPDTYPTSFEPTLPSRYVLELPAGYTVQHNVHVGDAVGF